MDRIDFSCVEGLIEDAGCVAAAMQNEQPEAPSQAPIDDWEDIIPMKGKGRLLVGSTLHLPRVHVQARESRERERWNPRVSKGKAA